MNLIERIVLEMGFVWNSTNLEAGIDGTIEIRNSESNEATNFIIQVQSKATEKPFQAETNTSFEYLCDERDLDYWLKGNCPVVLVCSNVTENNAYWVSIKDYFKDNSKRKARKIIFDKKKNAFTKESKSELENLAIPETSGFYLSPVPVQEKIYSNLLELKNYPDIIYEAKTKYRNFKNLWSALNELEDTTGINKSYILHEGKIFSFNDLSKFPWSNFTTSKVKTFETTKWSQSHDLNIKRQFVRLMNNAFESFLYRKGILHKKTRKIDLFYFRPTIGDDDFPKDKTIRYNRLGRKSPIGVCSRYYRKSDPTKLSYFRHFAFEASFLRFVNSWFLEITPTYYFTHNGFKVHTYYESKLKGKKGLDKPANVFSGTLFWATILTRDKNDMFNRSILEFGTLFNSEIDAGIDDKMWLNREDESKKKVLKNQLSIFDDEN